MKCTNCGSFYIELVGNIELTDDIIGPYTVKNVRYLKCEHCDGILLPGDTWSIADQELLKITRYLIGQLPASEFIQAKAAADILGISKQAFCKNKRIKNGFIHSAIVNGRTGYHRRSVELFRDTGDGRFKLDHQNTSIIKYVVITKQLPEATSRYSKSIEITNDYEKWLNDHGEMRTYNA
ncbi:MAG: hypothetical protein RBS34_13640 [Desulfofustis sp.]|jgi:hypothetical protein|nr:hypothetical protein [Desulfofustis sp.]